MPDDGRDQDPWAPRAVVFDFDGTLWDPETIIYQAYVGLFHDCGGQLSRELWGTAVGRIDVDMWSHLSRQTGREPDRPALREELERRLAQQLAGAGPRPGVLELIRAIDERGWVRAIVSNNHQAWVQKYADQCAVAAGWVAICCADGDHARAKPRPDLYLQATAQLGLAPEQVIAFEDSPSGVRAAKAAGLRCVAVANPVTTYLDLTAADLWFDSFEDIDLAAMLQKLTSLEVSP